MNKKQQIIGLAIVLVLSINLFLPSYVFLKFKLNQQYVVENLCVQKDLEVNTCQGTCHLKKEIQEVTTQSQDDQQQGEWEIIQSPISIYYNNSITYKFNSISNFIKKVWGYLPVLSTSQGYFLSSYKPPQA